MDHVIAPADKRSRLLNAALSLAYRDGFGATSLADIASEAEVPLGNVYYYFKTKDEIGEAIVELRLSQLAAMLQRWDEEASPKDRLYRCIEGVLDNRKSLAERGCAVGTLCSELHSLASKRGAFERISPSRMLSRASPRRSPIST